MLPAPLDGRPRSAPPLPIDRGPLSGAVLQALGAGAPAAVLPSPSGEGDAYGDDLQLALYLCYELHYRSFAGVDDALEWDPELLRLRAGLEGEFLAALRSEATGGDDVEGAVADLLAERPDAPGPSHHLASRGALWQLREYVVHRSLYHLKEADPQAWVIPRLEGGAKTSLVTLVHDEYGGGRPERLHARLFADMMCALDLDPDYGAYLEVVPAVTLATVNAMSLFGLHRRWRGALIGQFASVEVTSSPGSARLARALRRLAGGGTAVTGFYDEHVEADAVHEQLVRHGVIGGLLEVEPGLAADVVFGIEVSSLLENRLADHLLSAWAGGHSSLRAGGSSVTGSSVTGSSGDAPRARWLVSQNG